ncbi:MAG: hypothetical protein ACN6P1_05470 [Pseudomonas sp.]|uniref:hypothetical protein n=1 Tax=Pseudomonas sp. TaxID=306 RepID=UPI003D0BE9B4
MSKQCVNCPGAVDHSTAECPIRATFETYMLGREHPVIGWIDSHWFRRGDDPATYANDYVQGCWVMWQANRRAVRMPDGWTIERTPDGALCLTNHDHSHRSFFSSRGHAPARAITAFLEAFLAASAAAKVQHVGCDLIVHPKGVQNSSHPALISLDKQCRDNVARALGLSPTAERDFAWSHLLARVREFQGFQASARPKHHPTCLLLDPEEPEARCTCGAIGGAV